MTTKIEAKALHSDLTVVNPLSQTQIWLTKVIYACQLNWAKTALANIFLTDLIKNNLTIGQFNY